MTVRENLMIVPPRQAGENLLRSWLEWGRVKAQDRRIRDKVDEVLDFLQITHVADELAGNLSAARRNWSNWAAP